ncbi:MAG: phage/plasmid replication protein [Terriglobia bacterium]
MSQLTNAKEIIDRDTGEVRYSGRLKNLTVKVSPSSIWLTGSLPKFHLGSNVETLSRKEISRAIEHLSDELNQPMAEARVFRVDIAQTFAMEKPPSEYWGSLLAPTRMLRIEAPGETLTFRNGQRAILFYDKLAQMRREEKHSNHHGSYVDLGRFVGDPNLLRYEVQFKQRLRKVFNEPELKAASLSSSEFYRKVVERWAAEYSKLGRISSVSRQPLGTTVKSALNHLAALGLISFPPQLYLDRIATAQHAGQINKYQAARLRQKCRELLTVGGVAGAGDVLQELDAKVGQAVALCE